MKKRIIILQIIFSINCFAQWSQKTNFGGGIRWGASGFSINKRGYAGLGYNPYPPYSNNDLWEYDPLTNQWTQKSSLPVGAYRGEAVAFSIDSLGYIGTGLGSSILKDFWEYDPNTDKWTQLKDFGGGPRQQAVGFSIGKKGYLGLGGNSTGTKNDFWEFDPKANSWTLLDSFPGAPRTDPLGFAINGKGYVGFGTNSGSLNDLWEYNPVAKSWTKKSNLPGSPRAGAGVFVIGNKAYIGGGLDWGANQTLNDFWEYDANLDLWSLVLSLPDSTRGFFPTFSIQNKGYLTTGYNNNKGTTYSLASTWEYTPIVSDIEKIESDTSVYLIIPNPSFGKFSISSPYKINSVMVYNILGEIIYTTFSFQTSNEIDLSNHPKGIYFIRILEGTKIHNRWILIQ